MLPNDVCWTSKTNLLSTLKSTTVLPYFNVLNAN